MRFVPNVIRGTIIIETICCGRRQHKIHVLKYIVRTNHNRAISARNQIPAHKSKRRIQFKMVNNWCDNITVKTTTTTAIAVDRVSNAFLSINYVNPQSTNTKAWWKRLLNEICRPIKCQHNLRISRIQFAAIIVRCAVLCATIQPFNAFSIHGLSFVLVPN